MSPFGDLRVMLAEQQARLAERIRAVDAAEQAMDRLWSAFLVPVLQPV